MRISTCAQRKSAIALCATVLLILGVTSGEGGGERRRFRLEAGHLVPLQSGSWHVVLNESGTLRISTADKDRALHLPKERTQDILHLLQREDFFGLRETYGTQTSEGDIRQILVRVGGREKKVFLGSDMKAEPNQEEAKRVLRVWIAIRGLFEIPGAADSRTFDRTLLEQ